MLDPRIDTLYKEIEKLKLAILVLAGSLDGVSWRIASEEERRAGVEVYEKIKRIMEKET